MMLILAIHENESTGVCNPSVSLLAKEANLDRTNVFKILSELKAEGEISIESGKGQKLSNQYTILLPRIDNVNGRKSATIPNNVNSGEFASGIVANSQLNGRKSATEWSQGCDTNKKNNKTNNKTNNSGCCEDLLNEKKPNLNGIQSKGSESEIEGQSSLNGRTNVEQQSSFTESDFRRYFDTVGTKGINDLDSLIEARLKDAKLDPKLQEFFAELDLSVAQNRQNELQDVYNRFVSCIRNSISNRTLASSAEIDAAFSQSHLSDFEFNERMLRAVFIGEWSLEFGMLGARDEWILDELVSIVKRHFSEPQESAYSEPVW